MPADCQWRALSTWNAIVLEVPITMLTGGREKHNAVTRMRADRDVWIHIPPADQRPARIGNKPLLARRVASR